MSHPHKLLVANRGEIALRIIRTAKTLSIPTISIFTEVEDTAAHVFAANEAVTVPNYTDGDSIIAAAIEARATLLHPGYGFLSENHEFATKVEQAGITWLGPRPSQIKNMGLKHEARLSATEAGVPILIGSGLVSTLEKALQEAALIGYPVMLKATGGGGGMGMVICHDAATLESEFAKTVAMTENLFSDGGVFIESFIPRARHIEIQVFGDGKGNVVHIGERECSVQRRNQKVLEEAQSPFILRHPELGEAMCAAAVRLCSLISYYRSAGTVEFLVDDTTSKFYFLELNSRIQVEHAVTEAVRPGLDIVALMIKLGLSDSGGAPFSLPSQASLALAHGHAIEARIYAEIPHLNFKPAPGLLQLVEFPKYDWLRIDSWVSTGTFISPFYDPMIAKLIAHGPDRETARQRLAEALSTVKIQGTQTNIAYLQAIVDCKEFKAGDVTTSFLGSFDYTPNCLEFLDAGLSTTVQDLRPRITASGDGIPPGGPMDTLAHRCANVLAGNPPETETLEIFLTGPSIQFTTATVVGVAGADGEILLDGVLQAMWSKIVVPAGSILEFGACEATGSRVYLAIRGGFPEVPYYMDSKSTFTGGGFGGVQGREIATGDVITLAPSGAPLLTDKNLTLPESLRITYSHSWNLAAVPGPHADACYLTPTDLSALFSTEFSVTIDSNRSGIRLEGLKPLTYAREDGGSGGGHPSNVLDHGGYNVGAMNLNGDTPVIFTVDGPDCGGFVCVLSVLTTDHWKFGQIRPGDKLRFVETSIEAARHHRESQLEWTNNVARFLESQGTHSAAVALGFLEPLVDPTFVAGDGVLASQPADPSIFQPILSYRQAGNGSILVEVGPQSISFATRVYGELWERRMRALNVKGLLTIIQGASSVAFRFDSSVVSQATILTNLQAAAVGLGLASRSDTPIPSRRVHLPIVFEDSAGLEAIQRYMNTTGRKKSVYLPSNVDYLAKVLGAPDKATVFTTFLSSDWYVTCRAFFCGLPFLLPIDQRACLAAQKYNPSRTYTPSGAVGFAGSTAAIYPVPAPGGYQILGRTLTPWQVNSPDGSFEGHFLLRSFDMVRWIPMSEEEFERVEKLFKKRAYTVLIEDIEISAKEIAALEESTSAVVKQNEITQRANMAKLSIEEKAYVAEWLAEKEKSKITPVASVGGGTGEQAGTPLKSPVHSVVRAILGKVGDLLVADGVVARLEAMKTEVEFKVPRRCIGKTITSIAVKVGDQLSPGQALFYCE